MKVQQSTIRKLTITEAPNLDPIDVMIDDIAPGKGRITIRCFTSAWTAYWGSMGCAVAEFVANAPADCIAADLMWGKELSRGDEKWLAQIIDAVKAAMAEVKP